MPKPSFRDKPYKSPGRPKGSVNKVTQDIRAMIAAALDKAGGEKYLVNQARKNPNAFLSLVGKIIPAQIIGDKDNPIEMVHIITRRIIGG
jgi:hypothetical protein